jgi:uncharacterized protein
LEYRDVIGSLRYIKGREELRHMTLGLFSRCCGANATMIAMTRHPEFFEDIRCMVAPQPISLRPFYEKITKALGIADRIDEVDTELRKATSFSMDEMSVIKYAKAPWDERRFQAPAFTAENCIFNSR